MVIGDTPASSTDGQATRTSITTRSEASTALVMCLDLSSRVDDTDTVNVVMLSDHKLTSDQLDSVLRTAQFARQMHLYKSGK